MDRVNLFVKRFREAWVACLFCMVQGDLTVISINHAITAAKTGTIAASVLVALSYSPKLSGSKTWSLWLIGVITSISDYAVHPTHFGPELAEALCTGVGAAGIAYVMMTFVDKEKPPQT